MKIIIVGGGEIGKRLTNLLSSEKNDVVLVESSEQAAKENADHTDALVINGDGTDISVLKDAGLERADVIVAATADDKVNLMVCQIAKTSAIKKIVSRVNLSGNEELFTKLGVENIIPMVGLAVTAMKRSLSYEQERVIAQASNTLKIVELAVGNKSKVIGKNCSFRNFTVNSVYRNGEYLIPGSQTKIQKGDVLIVTLKGEDTKQVRKMITGK